MKVLNTNTFNLLSTSIIMCNNVHALQLISNINQSLVWRARASCEGVGPPDYPKPA